MSTHPTAPLIWRCTKLAHWMLPSNASCHPPHSVRVTLHVTFWIDGVWFSRQPGLDGHVLTPQPSPQSATTAPTNTIRLMILSFLHDSPRGERMIRLRSGSINTAFALLTIVSAITPVPSVAAWG
jgi:hypothetical protein